MQAGYAGFDKRLKYLFDNATEVSAESLLSDGTPIGRITVDGSTVTLKAPSSGGGSNVVVTPILQTGEHIANISVDGVVNALYAPYGGGGVSMPFTCDLLFYNDPMPSPTSGTNSVNRSYTLSKSINNYDAVFVTAQAYYVSNGYEQEMSQIVLKRDYYNQGTYPGEEAYAFLLNGDKSEYLRKLYFKFSDDTTIDTIAARSQNGVEPMLFKVYGLKFSATIISPEVYTTSEREIGVHIDGKPLYQKTFLFTNIDSSTQVLTLNQAEADNWEYFETYDTNEMVLNPPKTANKPILQASALHSGCRVNLQYDPTNGYFMDINDSYMGADYTRDLYVTVRYTKKTDTAGSGTWTPTGQFANVYSTSEHTVGKWINGSDLYERTLELTFNDLDGGTISSSRLNGRINLSTIIGNDIDFITLVDDASCITVPWNNTVSVLRSVPINYPNGSEYVRTNIQQLNNTGDAFIYMDCTYAASSYYQLLNVAKIYITIRYTKSI